MNRPKRMLLENLAWARETAHADEQFFPRLAQGQSPKVLWIGCADSRVPAETVTNANPGDLFVHRNIANLFSPSDDNTMSVLEYGVRVLKVDHVIICGHYGCGGVRASLLPQSSDLPHVNRRIAPLCALGERHRDELDAHTELDARANRLAELNVLEQVRLLQQHSVVRDREVPPLVHGWIFGLHDGLINVLACGYEAEGITQDDKRMQVASLQAA
ncbi:carbonic anhydrase (plasmid) [Burkholderia sp. THE68]|uniref:carbonic anhydrase n=1 Tax=Burkholderiaceae TaxID=119060 RepID=UPI00131928D9|nr:MULTISPECIES: carbonic anhydrase [Burkholderiaceae]BBU32112.1 carbonic anhydrase [Burkholderia sp. THE68]BCQ27421.1 carbonic anhydrase [Caballeronia sp. NK8]